MSRVNDGSIRVRVLRQQSAKRHDELVNVAKKADVDDTQHGSEEKQMVELVRKLPQLNTLFELHRKIGEGTFSSVYLASLRCQASLPNGQRRLFAVKHLVPTAHPARIEHELRCLQDIGGRDNVIGVELCLRQEDTIVFVMPYIPHRKFSEYVGSLDGPALRQYVRALLQALQRVHSFGVIHRDVKPSNFLYDVSSHTYVLVDFGLAQRLPVAVTADDARRPLRPTNKRSREESQETSLPPAKRTATDACAATPPLHSKTGGGGGGECSCMGCGAVCATCLARPSGRAPRAGTQGFRPPEVLLKYPHQTTAVDIWACGVIVLSVLSGRYPFFRASDDASAAAELVSLIGSERMQRVARSLGRRLVASSTRRGLCLRKLCARLRFPPGPGDPARPSCRHCGLPQSECVCRDERVPAEHVDTTRTWAGFPDAAFALCAHLLDPDPRTRISAADALAHPFLTSVDC